jgi:outer membrane protein TolC
MMMKKSFVLIVLLFLSTASAKTQTLMDSIFVVPENAYVFTIGNYYQLIRDNHPVVKQVELLSELAKQEIRLARGNFDPKIEASLAQKNLKGTEYYNIGNAELKFPSFFPVDPKVGIDRNKGAYLNPERYISADADYRQFYAGISLPIGRGLFTDDRRTALHQAELFTQSTEAEQVKMANKLLLDAAKDYWQWYYSYYNFRIYDRSVRIAKDIFDRVKTNHTYGEVASIDTVQARIIWQQRLVERQEAWLEFTNAGIQISNYLWDSLANPLDLPVNWIPADETAFSLLDATTIEELMQQSKENHPELQKIRIKLQHQEYDRRLAVENLKPRLDLNYSFINQPFNSSIEFLAPTFKDYKFGVDFSFPLFLRKERAKVAFTKLKISNTEYEERLTQLQITNEVESVYNIIKNNQNILVKQAGIAENYERLLQAEYLNLENGESDLFKLNLQQEKFIQAQSKVLKLKAELEKQKAMLFWAAGVSNLGM